MKYIYLAILIPSLILNPFFAYQANAATDIVNDATLGTSLQGCWELDEASGDRTDSSANGNTLVDVNTVLSTTGVVDDAADFELSNSELLKITDANQTGLDAMANLTIATWVNFETDPSSNMNLVSKFRVDSGTDSNNGFSYRFYVTGTTITAALWDGTNFKVPAVSWNPSAATTYHVAMTFNSTSDEVKFYVNGSQQGSTQSVASIGTLKNSTGSFALGASGAPGGGAEEFLDGWLDVTAVWSTDLSGTSIGDLYASGSGIPCVAAAAPAEATTSPQTIWHGNTVIGSGVFW